MPAKKMFTGKGEVLIKDGLKYKGYIGYVVVKFSTHYALLEADDWRIAKFNDGDIFPGIFYRQVMSKLTAPFLFATDTIGFFIVDDTYRFTTPNFYIQFDYTANTNLGITNINM